MLGEPFSNELAATKKGKFLGRYLTYYVTKLNKDGANEKTDRYAWIRFNLENHLVSTYSNVEGHEIGQPATTSPPPVPPLAR